MGDALQSLRDGDLDATYSRLKEQVCSAPANVKERIFLFQLLAIMGDWNRAMTQLNVIAELDDGTLAMVQTYREAINCEVLRQGVFDGQYTPLIFGEPEQWVAELLEALKLVSEKQYQLSQPLYKKAFDAAPVTTGKIDGEAFNWIADADSRLGPVLEAVINGRYYWIPFHRISKILLEEPCDLRDNIWMPAHFTWVNGGETVALIPTRYASSETVTDPQIRLARKTEWQACAENFYLGFGQRLLVTDVGEFPLMDIREIVLNHNG